MPARSLLPSNPLAGDRTFQELQDAIRAVPVKEAPAGGGRFLTFAQLREFIGLVGPTPHDHSNFNAALAGE